MKHYGVQVFFVILFFILTRFPNYFCSHFLFLTIFIDIFSILMICLFFFLNSNNYSDVFFILVFSALNGKNTISPYAQVKFSKKVHPFYYTTSSGVKSPTFRTRVQIFFFCPQCANCYFSHHNASLYFLNYNIMIYNFTFCSSLEILLR